MFSFKHIAQSIVEEISLIFDFPIMITDEKGVIIGSTDKNRLGSYHIVTDNVTQSGEIMDFPEEQTKKLENVLPGVAAPLTFHQKTVGIIGLIGDVEKVKRYAPFVQTHIELLLMEKFRSKTVVAQMEVLRDFAYLLLSKKRTEGSKEIIHYSQLLGFDADLPRRCILIDFPLNAEQRKRFGVPFNGMEQNFFLLLNNLFVKNTQTIISPLHPGEWVIFSAVEKNRPPLLKEKLEEATTAIQHFSKTNDLNEKITISYGDVYSQLSGVYHSYEQSRKAMAIAKKNHLPDPIVSLDDWNLLSVALIEEITLPARQTLDDYIDKIHSHPNGTALIESFIVYCEEKLNMSKASRNLFIHRNTLLYRLQQLQQLTNINIESFDQCMLLYLTLKQNEKRGSRV